MSDQKKILLVDDESDFVEALSARLETREMIVTSAPDGMTALKEIKKQKFDMVILDVAMPGMDGIDTLREMKKLDPDLQIILLTGHATVQNGIEAIKLGAMDFLEKPVDINVLLEKVREAKAKGEDLMEKKTQKIIDDIIKSKGW